MHFSHLVIFLPNDNRQDKVIVIVNRIVTTMDYPLGAVRKISD